MGKTLTVLADLTDRRAHPAVLQVKEAIGPTLERLVFTCPDFAQAETDPCDVTAFRISRNEFRHYTPASVDNDTASMSVIIQRHDHGPGEELITSWSEGDEVRVCRWASTRSFRWPSGDDPVCVMGDGTVIGLAISMAERAERDCREFSAVLEVNAEDVEAVRKLLPNSNVVAATDEPGDAIDSWIADHPQHVSAGEGTLFYLAGHGQSIQRQRAYLRDTLGVDRRRVRTQPYWATGKVGL